MSVSAVKKSSARIPRAWDLRNSPQVRPSRRGTGPSPFARSSVRNLGRRDSDAQLGEFATDPHAPPPGVLPSHSQDELSNLIGDRRPSAGRPSPVGPLPSHELPVPPKE